MGNRAVLTLAQNPTRQSPAIYLHWNGGPESVLAFLDVAAGYGVRSDERYGTARLAQIIGNFFGGTLSVGVSPLVNCDCDNGDNGVFIARWVNQEPTVLGSVGGFWEVKQYPDGNYNTGAAVLLNPEEIHASKYWEKNDAGVPSIIAAIKAKNDLHFLNGSNYKVKGEREANQILWERIEKLPKIMDALSVAEATIRRLCKTDAQLESCRGTLDVIASAIATETKART